jgi:transcriptional regulator with XRE-family HTH domain
MAMGTKSKNRFGQLVREKRKAKGLSLRKFSEMVGVSPTYLSQVEKGNCDPPTASRVRRMAEILGENSDELTALAGRVPEDLPGILQKQPARLAAFIREVSDLTPEQLTVLSEEARRLKGSGTLQRGQTSTNHS